MGGSEAAASSAGSPAGRNRGGPGNFILGAPPTRVADRTTALFWEILCVFNTCVVAVGDAGSGWNDGQVSSCFRS